MHLLRKWSVGCSQHLAAVLAASSLALSAACSNATAPKTDDRKTPEPAAQSAATSFSSDATTITSAQRTPVQRTWTIEGVEREALVVAPTQRAEGALAPVVFIFHGHGGRAAQVRRSYDAEKYWPEALFVYPQGLKTPGALTDPEGRRAGWQSGAAAMGGRDLNFFDAILKSILTEQRGDPDRVYVTGHSNGGGFTYLLWSERGAQLAAVGPSSAYARVGNDRPPLPAMHVAQRNDPLVKFDMQELTIAKIKATNGCVANSTQVAKSGKLYDSPTGTPVLVWVTDGTHKFDATSVEPMMEFFRSHIRHGRSQ
ncbi:MAG: esterase [Planctomycetota bacterium]|nr:esterase [Planctomycetota bacterium]